jgi:hypothetical protein
MTCDSWPDKRYALLALGLHIVVRFHLLPLWYFVSNFRMACIECAWRCLETAHIYTIRLFQHRS